MLRITRCMSADGAERYFDQALKRSDYYAKEVGLWGGKGAQRLQLKGEVEREDFVALVRNRVPGSKGQDRLTARNNTTREEWKLGVFAYPRKKVQSRITPPKRSRF